MGAHNWPEHTNSLYLAILLSIMNLLIAQWPAGQYPAGSADLRQIDYLCCKATAISYKVSIVHFLHFNLDFLNHRG
jgi:hypothetical protein